MALPSLSDQLRAAIAFYPYCRDALNDPFAAKNCCGHTLQYNRDAAKDTEDQVRRFLAEHMKGVEREGAR